MNRKAFFLSIEAGISLLVLALVIIAPFGQQQPDLDELHLLQKEHDLLLLWARERAGAEQVQKDFSFVFPSLSGEAQLNGEKIKLGTYEKNFSRKSAAAILFLSDFLELEELRLTVFH